MLNSALKYADDFTLIAPENTDVSAEDEMRNVLLWSDDNKLSVNLLKCKEIVFRRPSVKLDILPVPLADIERVSCAKLLGVFNQSINQSINQSMIIRHTTKHKS